MAMKCTDRGDDELVQKHTEDLNISMNTSDQEETGEFTLSSMCPKGESVTSASSQPIL